MIKLQIAVREKLFGVLSVPVLDRYPHKQDKLNPIKPPYVVIGEDTFIPFDSDGKTGFVATLNIHVWSVFNGREECKGIQEQIYNALHRSCLDIEGFNSVGVDFEFADTLLDSDGVTTHGVVQFRFTGVKNG